MCGRARCTLNEDCLQRNSQVPRDKWIDWEKFEPRFNISPGSYMPVLRNSDLNFQKKVGENLDDKETKRISFKRTLHFMKWGLIPSFTKPSDKEDYYRMFNARSESLHEKPSFRRLLKFNRCVVFVEGFYEWKKNGKQKQPYYIHCKDEIPLTFAAVYDKWQRESGEVLYTFSIVTTRVSKRLEWLHDRMPAILPDDKAVQQWLRGELSVTDIAKLTKPYNGEDLVWHPVTPAMGKPSFQGSECIAKLKPEVPKKNILAEMFGRKTRESFQQHKKTGVKQEDERSLQKVDSGSNVSKRSSHEMGLDSTEETSISKKVKEELR